MSENANENDIGREPLSDDAKRDMLAVHLAAVRRLAIDLEPAAPAAEGNPFDAVDAPEPLGDMGDETGSAVVARAVHSLAAATSEVRTAETVVGLVEYIAARFAIVLG